MASARYSSRFRRRALTWQKTLTELKLLKEGETIDTMTVAAFTERIFQGEAILEEADEVRKALAPRRTDGRSE